MFPRGRTMGARRSPIRDGPGGNWGRSPRRRSQPRKGFGCSHRKSPSPHRRSPIRRPPRSRSRRSPPRRRSSSPHRRSHSPWRWSPPGRGSPARRFNSSSNTSLDCGAKVKVDRDSLNKLLTKSKYNISNLFETDKKELKKKEWPNFSFGQAPASFEDEKRIDKDETKGNLVKNPSEENLDKGEPCANLASFSFVKTVKDDKRANMNNNSSFATFTIVKLGDVKTKEKEPDARSVYIESSAVDSKSVINEAFKGIEEADNTRNSEIDNVLSTFRFIKSSIRKETLNDWGKKTVEKCKDSSDLNNDLTTFESENLLISCANFIEMKSKDIKSLGSFLQAVAENGDRMSTVHKLGVLMKEKSPCSNCNASPCQNGVAVQDDQFRVGLKVTINPGETWVPTISYWSGEVVDIVSDNVVRVKRKCNYVEDGDDITKSGLDEYEISLNDELRFLFSCFVSEKM